MNRYWLLIVLAGIFEVTWVSGLKHSDNILEWSLTIACILVSFAILPLAASHLPVGTVYAVFTGLGTGGTVLSEMIIFGEPFDLTKIIFITILLIGVIGLKVVTTDQPSESTGDA